MTDKLISQTILKYKMLSQSVHIIVGVSGGADSMCLIHFLSSISDEMEIELTVAHLNHMIRGNEALRDELFVEQWCKENGIKFICERVDIPKLAKEKKLGLEECGRLARYDFFNRLAGVNGIIATAHTASDNAETLLFNIARGCGINGIGGISPIRDNIIRPLIELSREQVETYCEKHKVEYITDSTNLSDDYTRNLIRHNVIPVLKKLNSSFISSTTQLSQFAREDNDCLNELARKELINAKTLDGYNANYIKNLPLSIAKRAIIELVGQHGASISSRQLDLVLDILRSSGAVELNSTYTITVKDGQLRVQENKDGTAEKEQDWQINAKNTTLFDKNNKKYVFKLEKSDEIIKKIKFDKLLFNNSIDCAIITDNTLFRNRRPGDTFTQSGRKCTKSLKKLFNELHISPDKRDKLALLANGNEVLWIEGIGVSEKAKITDSTTIVANIMIEES